MWFFGKLIINKRRRGLVGNTTSFAAEDRGQKPKFGKIFEKRKF